MLNESCWNKYRISLIVHWENNAVNRFYCEIHKTKSRQTRKKKTMSTLKSVILLCRRFFSSAVISYGVKINKTVVSLFCSILPCCQRSSDFENNSTFTNVYKFFYFFFSFLFRTPLVIQLKSNEIIIDRQIEMKQPKWINWISQHNERKKVFSSWINILEFFFYYSTVLFCALPLNLIKTINKSYCHLV